MDNTKRKQIGFKQIAAIALTACGVLLALPAKSTKPIQSWISARSAQPSTEPAETQNETSQPITTSAIDTETTDTTAIDAAANDAIANQSLAKNTASNATLQSIPAYPEYATIGQFERPPTLNPLIESGQHAAGHSITPGPQGVARAVFEAPTNSSATTYQEIAQVAYQEGYGDAGAQDPPARMMIGVDGNTCRTFNEPRWQDVRPIPFESFSYGEYIGPHRTPHVPEYRIRVNDQLEFVYILTRKMSGGVYRLGVGDVIAVSSTTEEALRQPTVPILPDGSISLPQIGRLIAAGKTMDKLSDEINRKYQEAGVKFPEVVVQGVQVNTRLQDLRDAVDARAGIGGTSRQAQVAPDGTIQLPLIHSVPAVGLTLKEIGREINARYAQYVEGIEITPILVQRAPRVAYVLGEVQQPGRIDLVGPTTTLQSIALAGGWNPGGNIRQIIIFRRDANWNLMATRLDLAGALHGRRPYPSDEIFIRDGDIILVPKQPIQRLADAIDLYVSRTIYAVFPNQGFNVNFNSGSEL